MNCACEDCLNEVTDTLLCDFHFSFYDRGTWQVKINRRQPVIRSDGEKYPDMIECSVKNHITMTELSEALKNNTLINGFRFIYYHERRAWVRRPSPKDAYQRYKKLKEEYGYQKGERILFQTDSGEVFQSLAELRYKYNLSDHSIVTLIMNGMMFPNGDFVYLLPKEEEI